MDNVKEEVDIRAVGKKEAEERFAAFAILVTDKNVEIGTHMFGENRHCYRVPSRPRFSWDRLCTDWESNPRLDFAETCSNCTDRCCVIEIDIGRVSRDILEGREVAEKIQHLTGIAQYCRV